MVYNFITKKYLRKEEYEMYFKVIMEQRDTDFLSG